MKPASDLPASQRYPLLDALRGIAALSVAFYHLGPKTLAGVEGHLAEGLTRLLALGAHGVEIFFVISGFVIAASIGERRTTGRYIGKFALKRSLRLDPPYWVSIALDLILIGVVAQVFGKAVTWPSTGAVAAHAFYLQDLLQLPSISPIYWTLCLEVQFYLFYVLVLSLGSRRPGASPLFTGRGHFTLPVGLLFWGATIFSVGVLAKLWDNLHPGLFLSYWCCYFLGTTLYWSLLEKRLDPRYTLALAALILWSALYNMGSNAGSLAAVGAGVLIALAIRLNRLNRWLCWRPLLFLGAISYSLYLYHAIIGERLLAFVQEWLLPRAGIAIDSLPAAGLLLTGVLAVVTLCAWIILRLVEAPSHALSRRIRPAATSPALVELQTPRATRLGGPHSMSDPAA